MGLRVTNPCHPEGSASESEANRRAVEGPCVFPMAARKLSMVLLDCGHRRCRTWRCLIPIKSRTSHLLKLTARSCLAGVIWHACHTPTSPADHSLLCPQRCRGLFVAWPLLLQ